ncbi:hypothetical protein CWC22_007300 [Pseudoalteromonas rubra]|uniref:Uncharacterized protein n=1 Tax=Pseudoalteromonas rubra TaxID=43658 RepID=A0A7S7YSP5_9GAMM|nr:hypothetical protein [Pseudoalteromonas rubra]QPB82813.1 hypothetical protein CWC22_007300 [Pseudoalteromonas rubra]
MKAFFNFILMVAVGLVIAWGTRFWFSDRADVVVESSLLVEVAFAAPDVKGYQRSYTIRNAGDVAAQNIIVKHAPQVKEYKITKASDNDEVADSNSEGVIDLNYKNLNPGSAFTLFVLYEEPTENSLIVSHAGGVVRSSSDSEKKQDGSFYFLIMIVIGSLTYLLFSSRMFALSRLYIYPSKADLKRKRRWYVTEKEHEEIVSQSIAVLLVPEFSYSKSIEEWSSMKFLLDDEISQLELTSEMKEYLVKGLNDMFLAESEYYIPKMDSLMEVERLFQKTKPELITDTTWSEFKESLVEQLESLANSCRYEFGRINRVDLIASLSKGHVGGMERDQFDRYKKELQSSLLNTYISEIARTVQIGNPRLDLNNPEGLDLLSEYDKDKLASLLYEMNFTHLFYYRHRFSYSEEAIRDRLSSRPQWVNKEHWERVEEVDKRALRSYAIERLFERFQDECWSRLNISVKGTEAEALFDYLVGLQNLKLDLTQKKRDLEVKQLDIVNSEKSWDSKVTRLQKQLDILDDLLTGRLTLGRLEYPEAIFSEKNLENLRKIEALHRQPEAVSE